jgi:hypothetical protein
VRLSKKPDDDVSIFVKSIPTATDRLLPSTFTLGNRDYNERDQLEIQGPLDSEAGGVIELKFTTEDWKEWKTVNVFAIEDDQEEGTNLLYFPKQPSYLSFIQGPVRVVGEGKAEIPAISDPLMLPSEFDDLVFDPKFELPSNGSLYAIEANQVDKLIIYK